MRYAAPDAGRDHRPAGQPGSYARLGQVVIERPVLDLRPDYTALRPGARLNRRAVGGSVL